ncbi:hypothetical protein HNY73_014977 [Argiope bruennichi]|uniref:Uncharacterized protein n=1 Tax=Argiope bruennichi TaxID=94029 RepID=A0A8T0EV31_ARGBR|nr:hypothetical protein HNY73_014977 [Argiope bruennichi]
MGHVAMPETTKSAIVKRTTKYLRVLVKNAFAVPMDSAVSTVPEIKCVLAILAMLNLKEGAQAFSQEN